MFEATFALLLLLPCILGHAVLQKPVPRGSGDATLALCGEAVTKKLDDDPAGPIENSVKVADASYKCNLYLCRGYQYEDNTDKVQVYAAGDVVTFHVDLVAAHRPGWANVSVIDLASNKAIGDPVKVWDVWPDNVAGGGDDVDFNITIPNSLGSACNAGGKCALQWFWWSNSNSQTYESCVDFYVKG
ncbi:hypothetical protein LA080_015955 [Diaporthe eres]|uniref:Chitin-binding type-4 domain-containing protein n=1 Tax=Diaporthe vaccinii TaxID=105482 RepID=A0ABR4F9A5_9PEZI|nr:hypothetical protein LA080_015955 [Diaporthe eres]